MRQYDMVSRARAEQVISAMRWQIETQALQMEALVKSRPPREPTHAMVIAAIRLPEESSVFVIWQAMYDAWIKECNK